MIQAQVLYIKRGEDHLFEVQQEVQPEKVADKVTNLLSQDAIKAQTLALFEQEIQKQQ